MRSLMALGALTTAALALTAAPAGAAPCPDLDGWQCHELTVPIAQDKPALGTTTIAYAVRPRDDQSRPAEGTTIASDAPGSPSIRNGAGYFQFAAIPDLGATHDLVVVDPRGTGDHALDCPQYQHGTTPFSVAIPACADQLDAARDYYTYGDLADDIDAVREVLHLDKVDLYATGHATPTMEAYAVRHPEHVHTLVLDSAASFPQWGNEDLANALNAITLVCRRSALCSAQIRDPAGELAWLAQRLRTQPLTGIGYDGDGQPRRVRLGEAELAWLLLFDKSGAVRTLAELPAAARALRAGDPVPLLRLAAENEGPLPYEPADEGDPTTEFSVASINAAFCPEWPFGWDKAAPLNVRLAQYRAARAALPRNFFAPFSFEVGTAPTPDQCLYWPAPTRTNPILPPGTHYPDVPVLVLSGDLNTDHPQAQGPRVAARFPHGRFVAIPQAGQSAVGWSACAFRIMHSFVTTLDPGETTCAPTENAVVPGVGAFPSSVRDYAPARPDPAKRDQSTRLDRQLAAVAVHTALDALYTRLGRAGGDSGRGLRGGTYTGVFGDTGLTLDLRRTKLVTDVEVSGTFLFGFSVPNDIRLTFKGCGITGTLQTTDSVFSNTLDEMHVDGRIGGRRIALLVPIH